MQQHNHYFLLRDAKQRILESEEQAAVNRKLRGLKLPQLSARQRLACVLVYLASWIDPKSMPAIPHKGSHH